MTDTARQRGIDALESTAMIIRDASGRDVEIDAPPSRVVSLVPSLTETLFDLGVGDTVVGITDYCIFPEEPLAELPRVGGTKDPNVDVIRALGPDLVHMNLEENLRQHARQLGGFTTVYASEPRSVTGVTELLATLGAIHGCGKRAAELASAIQAAAERARRSSFSFAVPIWKDPWMWCGGDTYVANLVEAVGGRNVLREMTRYPRLQTSEILALRPDVVFLPDEPYAFEDADRDLLLSAGFTDVRGPFPGHCFTWHGSRTLKALELLAEWAG